MTSDTWNDPLAPGDACPNCGQDDHDQLIWIDDERVRCASCGAVYVPAEGSARSGDVHDQPHG